LWMNDRGGDATVVGHRRDLNELASLLLTGETRRA